MRTGPWDKYIVVTNCEYVRHQGKKSYKDLSICIRKLRGTTKEQWAQMCELQGNVLVPAPAQPVEEPAPMPVPTVVPAPKPKAEPKPKPAPKPTLEQRRELRLARFAKSE
jgi:hypothetical protein